MYDKRQIYLPDYAFPHALKKYFCQNSEQT
jgi:hypothetical protein